MNGTQRSKVGASVSSRPSVRTLCGLYFCAMLAVIAYGCGKSSGDSYRHQLAISDIQSFLYLEPGTQTQVPQVRGSLRNLGTQTLIMVEFKLTFKNGRNQVIFEETAYPVYVSTLSHSRVSRPLGPGQQVKFAFKSPDCPKDWQPGQVDVRVTKIVASTS